MIHIQYWQIGLSLRWKRVNHLSAFCCAVRESPLSFLEEVRTTYRNVNVRGSFFSQSIGRRGNKEIGSIDRTLVNKNKADGANKCGRL